MKSVATFMLLVILLAAAFLAGRYFPNIANGTLPSVGGHESLLHIPVKGHCYVETIASANGETKTETFDGVNAIELREQWIVLYAEEKGQRAVMILPRGNNLQWIRRVRAEAP